MLVKPLHRSDLTGLLSECNIWSRRWGKFSLWNHWNDITIIFFNIFDRLCHLWWNWKWSPDGMTRETIVLDLTADLLDLQAGDLLCPVPDSSHQTMDRVKYVFFSPHFKWIYIHLSNGWKHNNWPILLLNYNFLAVQTKKVVTGNFISLEFATIVINFINLSLVQTTWRW